MRSLDYKDTEKKLEVNIYGLQFEINGKELNKIETDKLEDKDSLEEAIDSMLGTGAFKKINEKRISDGYEEMDSGVALTIIAFITDIYVESSIQPISNTIERYNKYEKQINNVRNYGKRGKYNNYNRRH